MMTPSTMCASGREGLSRGGDVVDGERNVGAQGGVLAVLLLGLVAVEFIGAQPYARCDRGRLIRLHRPVGQFRHDRHGVAAGVAACRPPTPPNLRKSLSLIADGLPAPTTISR